jgi:hypothetical protein
MQTKIPLPDEQPVPVNALRNKRAQIAGQIALLEADVQRLRASLIHLDSVLRLFDPELNPNDIAAQKHLPRRTEYFARGEMSQRVFHALRDNESVSANELASVALAEKGFGKGDRQVRRDFLNRFHHLLYHMGRRGHAVKVGHGEGSRWRLAPKDRDLL